MRQPDCCPKPRLQPDARFEPVWGPVAERVLRCARCGVLWKEEWTVRVGYDGQEDRDVFDYQRVEPPR